MLRAAALYLFGQHAQLCVLRSQAPRIWFSMMLHTEARNPVTCDDSVKGDRPECSFPIGQKISRREKIGFLIKALLDVEDSKDAVYGTLDAWVAWEQNFPIAPLKNVLLSLEREQQWHRVVQVIKWMLSKGQGNTIGTYQQLIRALDMDHRAEEAHNFWMKKIGNDFHSVPWQTCHVMISVYYRNNMLDRLVKGRLLKFKCSTINSIANVQWSIHD
uniref:Pentatricopeptide repeat-containing protein n=1 Tax=Opuntia streptacantha TaxID=393608 RepID=A0A7C8YNZ8_OPUST